MMALEVEDRTRSAAIENGFCVCKRASFDPWTCVCTCGRGLISMQDKVTHDSLAAGGALDEDAVLLLTPCWRRRYLELIDQARHLTKGGGGFSIYMITYGRDGRYAESSC